MLERRRGEKDIFELVTGSFSVQNVEVSIKMIFTAFLAEMIAVLSRLADVECEKQLFMSSPPLRRFEG